MAPCAPVVEAVAVAPCAEAADAEVVACAEAGVEEVAAAVGVVAAAAWRPWARPLSHLCLPTQLDMSCC